MAVNGTLSGTPFSADGGTNTFIVRATDPGGLFSTATMYLTVTPATPIQAALAMQTTNLLLSWGGGLGPYQVQMTTNLAAPFWQTVAASLTGNNLFVLPTNGAAFYRVVGQ